MAKHNGEMEIDGNSTHETFLILSANIDQDPDKAGSQASSNINLDSISPQVYDKIDQQEKDDPNVTAQDGSSLDGGSNGVQCVDNTLLIPRGLPNESNYYRRLYLGESGPQVILYNTTPAGCTSKSVQTDCQENDENIQSSTTDMCEDFAEGPEKRVPSSNTKSYTRNTSGEKTFVCTAEGCGRHFTSSGHLKYHQSTHSGEKPFKCPHPGCDRVFAWPAHLKYHVKTHSGERPFKCEVEGCGKSFYVLQRLNVHLRVHTGERPYTCEFEDCTKSFSTAGNLKNHMRIHTGERPYVCPFVACGRSFTEHSSLRKHKLRHTGEKPYTCEICGKSFSQSGSRNAHEKRHILEKPPRYKMSQLTMIEKGVDLEPTEEEASAVDSGTDQNPSLAFTAESVVKTTTVDHMVLAQPIIAKEVSIETTPVHSLEAVTQSVAEELISNQQNILPQTSTCVVSLAETVVAQQALLQSMLDGTAIIPVTQAGASSDDLTVVDHVLHQQDVEQIMQSVVNQHILSGQIQLPISGDVTVTNEQGTLSFITQSGGTPNIILSQSEQELNSLPSDEGTVVISSETNEEELE